MLHGGFGSASQAKKSYHWDTEADVGHFLVVYPDGLDRAWKACEAAAGCPAGPVPTTSGFITDDVRHRARHSAYLGRVLRHRHQQRRHHGLLSRRPAATIFAAIGRTRQPSWAIRPVPVPRSAIAIHGTAENILDNGGEGDGTVHIDGPSFRAVNASWRRNRAARDRP